jgi:hypothetical protein
MGTIRTLVIGAVAALAPASQLWAVVGGAPPDARDHRFDAICAFGIEPNMLPTGCCVPGTCDCLNTFGNGTLIAPDMVLMAKHTGLETMGCDDSGNPFPGGFLFRFRRKLDDSLADPADCCSYFHVGVDHFITSPWCEDIAIAILEEEVTHIDPIPFDAAIELALTDPVIMGGWGGDGVFVHPGVLNLCEGTVAEITDCGRFSVAGDGCYVALYDSGGSVVVETENGLRVVGVIVGSGNVCVDAHAMLDESWEPGPCCGPIYLPHPNCVDFNDDDIVDIDDLLAVINNWGECTDCEDCPIDVTYDCVVGFDDYMEVIYQWGGPCIESCPADIVYDDVVDDDDLDMVLENWGSCICPTCFADVTHDGEVNVDDLMFIVNNWGACPS